MKTKRSALLKRLDAMALHQLVEAAAQLAEENEQLRSQLADAESCADMWQEVAMQVEEREESGHRATIGITRDGVIGVVNEQH